MKILVAEDNEQSLYLLDQYFTARGHQVWPAHNGREALAACQVRGVPDIVVSDALMPLVDGFELCDTVRHDPRLCGIPFVLYTATYTADSDERVALSLGVDRFVVKPIEPDRLLAVVEEVAASVRRAPARAPLASAPRAELLQEYARMVSVKLEDKLAELSRANAALQSSEESVRLLNDRLMASVKRLEAEIEERRRTEALLRLAQHAGGIGNWDCDETGRLRWSAEALELLGCAGGPGPGSFVEFVRLVVPEDRAGVEEALLGKQEPPAVEIEARFVCAAGGPPKHLLLRGGPLRDAGGHRLRQIGIVQDVTARAAAEARRQSLELQLYRSQKMEALGKLAGGIAHDFNNILTAILGNAGIVKLELRNAASAPGVADSLGEIEHAAGRARDIVGQILTFSRREPVERRKVSLSRVVEDALRLVRSTIGKSVKLRAELAPDLVVTANESQLHQVLLNLCTNAAQAMGAGGVVTVSLAPVVVTPADAAARPGLRAGSQARLDVRDTGTGIDPAAIDHVFEPFFTTKPPGKGTGLGLAVVHGIVQSHDGFVTVESTPGQGTTFSVFLPLAAEPAEPAPGVREDPPPAGSDRLLLVVDDEPSVARTCVKLLEQLGYRATAATDPGRAREMFEREPEVYAGAVVDFLMPRLTGLDLARAFWKRRPGFPVILIAGFGTQMDAARARADGFCGFVSKPFTASTLEEVLARAVK